MNKIEESGPESLSMWFERRMFEETILFRWFILPSAPEELRLALENAQRAERENLEFLQSRHPGYHGSFNPIEWTEAEENILSAFRKKTADARQAVDNWYLNESKA